MLIVLPVYNEESSLTPLLRRITVSMGRAGVSFGIVLIDDGSTDTSLEVAQSFAHFLALRIARHEKNQGLGKTIADGLRLAMEECSSGDVVVTMDADNSQPPELIPLMLTRLAAGFDVVIASRYARGASVLKVPFSRKLMSDLGNAAYRVRFRAKGVKDYTCGFRSYRFDILRDGLQVYGDRLIASPGFECMGEILVKLWRLGARITEIPFTLNYGAKPGLSKMRLPRTLLGNLRVLARGHRL